MQKDPFHFLVIHFYVDFGVYAIQSSSQQSSQLERWYQNDYVCLFCVATVTKVFGKEFFLQISLFFVRFLCVVSVYNFFIAATAAKRRNCFKQFRDKQCFGSALYLLSLHEKKGEKKTLRTPCLCVKSIRMSFMRKPGLSNKTDKK